MRCLLLGKNGQLGDAFARVLPNCFETIALGRNELNVLDLEKIRQIIQTIKPDLLINATAYTAVDRAESEVDLATSVNALAPRVMAEEMECLDGGFIHFSTDYVFDGFSNHPNRETDTPNPINIYGASKLYGEYLIQQVNRRFLIFRTSWVYSLTTDNFVTKVLVWARNNSEIKIVNDQIGNPTSAIALADLVTNIVSNNKENFLDYLLEAKGIYHCAGKGALSRYEFAKEILRIAPAISNVKNVEIISVSSDEFPAAAKRPSNSSLDLDLFEKKFLITIPNWQVDLYREFGFLSDG